MPPRNVIIEANGMPRLEVPEDSAFDWHPSLTAASFVAAAAALSPPSPDPDIPSVSLSTTSSPLSTVPTFPTEWSTKVQVDSNSRLVPSKFNYDAVDWSQLPGFSRPLEVLPRQLSSPIWRFGVPIEHSETSDRWWLCLDCHVNGAEINHRYVASKGTYSCIDHIKRVHCKTWNERKEIIDYIPTRSATPADLNANIPREQAIMNALATTYDEATFRRLLVRWIVYDNVSFRQVDSGPFREFIGYLSPQGGQSLPKHQTISAWILQSYAMHKVVVKDLLSKAMSKIHIAFDLWTSSNHQSLNGIIAHFIDTDFNPQSVVLGIPEQTQSHSGDKIATQVINIIKEYGIGDQLGYFVLDNATNNDTAMEAIAQEFGFHAKNRRLRCAGHIINLIARSLLYGFDKDLLVAEDDLLVDATLEEQLKHWRRCGPVGKAHNLIIWIYASPQRRCRWHEGELFVVLEHIQAF